MADYRIYLLDGVERIASAPSAGGQQLDLEDAIKTRLDDERGNID